MDRLRRLLRGRLRPYRGHLLVLAVLQLAQTVALLYLPTLNADIIDNGVLAGDTGYILRRGAVMIGITIVQAGCLLAAVRVGTFVAMSVGRDLRADIFTHVLDLSAREIGRFGTPSLITRTTNDVQQIQTTLQTGLTMFVTAPVVAVGGVVLASAQDVPSALVLLVMVPLIVVLMTVIVRRLRPIQRGMQRLVDTVNRALREQITGVRVIRAFNRDEFEQRRFGRVNTGLTDVSVRAGRLTTLIQPLGTTVMNLFSVPIVWLGAYRISSGHLQVGALTAFLGYLTLILLGLTTATLTLMTLPRAEASGERVAEVLDTASSVLPAQPPVLTLARPGELDVSDVDFSYPGAEVPVLRGVGLVARPGETTALIGSTGSGKSTLAALVARLADVRGGRILVGGVDVRELDRSLLARTVGLVPQTPVLFAGTVASNLRFGRPDATDEDLWHALDIAQARDFVARLPEGLAAPVAQGGTNLSGGQRQRIAIARVLVGRPQVYVFDDSFSALDHETEARLRAALAGEVAGRAVVVVSQRVASIRHADRIVVLEAGEVVGTGTHDELAAANPVYMEIVRSQLAGEAA